MTTIKTAYNYLEEMALIKSRSSFQKSVDPKTTRVLYLIEQLKEMKIKFIEDEFLIYPDEEYKFINIYVPFYCTEFETAETITFSAHHDINNPESQNCQDNTASVCNLLHLCSLLKEKKDLKRNVVICFLDGEEITSMKNGGSAKVSNKILENIEPFLNCKKNINLELTGNGNHVWADFISIQSKGIEETELQKEINNRIPDIKPAFTPFSDSVVFRYHNIDSVCIGLWTDADLASWENRSYPFTWRLCHRMEDTLDKISEGDMNRFVTKTLFNLL